MVFGSAWSALLLRVSMERVFEVTVWLCRDLSCDTSLGYQTMVASSTVGNVLQPYKERQGVNEIEDVLRSIPAKAQEHFVQFH